MGLYIYNGGLLSNAGGLAFSSSCCCNDCSGSCDAEGGCGPDCCCSTTYLPGSPGILETGCRRISDGYACCCESYQNLCYVDMSYCEPRAHSGPFPTIPGTPPPNAIALNNSSVFYCTVDQEVFGYWEFEDGPEGEDPIEIACYEFGYYFPVSDCADCAGQCTDWFNEGVFAPMFWGVFCDCATSNNVDLCCAACETSCPCGSYFVTDQGCESLGSFGYASGTIYYSMVAHLTVEWRGLTLPNVGGQDVWGGPEPRWTVGGTVFLGDNPTRYSGLSLTAGPVESLGLDFSNTRCYIDACGRAHLIGTIFVGRPSDDESCPVYSTFEWHYQIACEDDQGGQATVTLLGESSTCDSGNDTPVVTLSFMP